MGPLADRVTRGEHGAQQSAAASLWPRARAPGGQEGQWPWAMGTRVTVAEREAVPAYCFMSRKKKVLSNGAFSKVKHLNGKHRGDERTKRRLGGGDAGCTSPVTMRWHPGAHPTEKTRCGIPGERVGSSDSQTTGDHTGTPPLTSGANLRTRVSSPGRDVNSLRAGSSCYLQTDRKAAHGKALQAGSEQAAWRRTVPGQRESASRCGRGPGLPGSVTGCAEGRAASRHCSEPCFVH